ncbi:SURF1 family protein [Alteromonadaceae bacterium M269]|nr:SURF1 family protein [Alteromonadaceae bacterium M269]
MSAPEMNNSVESDGKINFPWMATIIALVAVVIMLRLGFWQIQRANHKTERLQQIEERSGVDALTVDEILSLDENPDDFRLQATGEFFKAVYFLLDNRVLNQKVGYEVVAPFLVGEHTLLVNLGWVQAPVSREDLPEIELPINEVRLYGMVSQPKKNPFVSQVDKSNKGGVIRVQEIDLSWMSEAIERPLLPFILQLSPEHELGFERNWKSVVMSPEKHWAYAVQWFGLAFACVIIYIVAIKKKYLRGNVG